MDTLVLALSGWDRKYSSSILSLSRVFAVSNRVSYVGNPFTIREVFSHFFSFHIRKRLLNLLFGGRNDQIVYKTIQRVIKKYQIKDFIYVNSFNPNFGNHFPASFRPKLTIYHCVDDISKSPHVSMHGTRLEQLVVRKADLVLTPSSELARLKSKESTRVRIHKEAISTDILVLRKARMAYAASNSREGQAAEFWKIMDESATDEKRKDAMSWQANDSKVVKMMIVGIVVIVYVLIFMKIVFLR